MKGSENVEYSYIPSGAQSDFLKIVIGFGLIEIILTASIFNPYLGLAALLLVIASLVVGVNLRLATLCFTFLLPFDLQVEYRPGIFVYFDLLFVLPAVVYFWRVMFGRSGVCKASLSLVPFLSFAVVTTLWRAQNFYWFSAYGVRLTVAVLFMAVISSIGEAENIVLLLGIALVPQTVYGLYQLVTRDLGFLYDLVNPHFQDQPWMDRAYAFFFHPNQYGSFCATVSLMLVALGIRSTSSGRRVLCYVLAVIGFVGLASSGSRGAWLGAFAGLVVLLAYSRASLRTKLALTVAVIAFVGIATTLEYAPLTRSSTMDDFTVDTRSTAYFAAAILFLQHPIIGVGLNNYQEYLPSVVDWDHGPAAAHNLYLHILAENGIVGFVLFFGPVFYILFKNLKVARQSTTAFLAATGLTVILAHGLFDAQFAVSPQYLLLFAILFGLASSCGDKLQVVREAKR